MNKKGEPEKLIEIEKDLNGDLIINGPINGNLYIKLNSCEKITLNSDSVGDITIDGNVEGDVTAGQYSRRESSLEYLTQSIKRILKRNKE